MVYLANGDIVTLSNKWICIFNDFENPEDNMFIPVKFYIMYDIKTHEINYNVNMLIPKDKLDSVIFHSTIKEQLLLTDHLSVEDLGNIIPMYKNLKRGKLFTLLSDYPENSKWTAIFKDLYFEIREAEGNIFTLPIHINYYAGLIYDFGNEDWAKYEYYPEKICYNIDFDKSYYCFLNDKIIPATDEDTKLLFSLIDNNNKVWDEKSLRINNKIIKRENINHNKYNKLKNALSLIKNEAELKNELKDIINKYNIDSELNKSDYILADCIINYLYNLKLYNLKL